MARLIPFVLKSGSEKRNSLFCPPSDPPTIAPPDIPTKSTRRPRPGPVTDLTIIPFTPTEWRKVMEEVRILYLKGQYKQCSARCKQILESIKDPYRTHPLYSIYLSFFAASSLELTARSLHNNSSNKLPTFQESLFFYQKAESYMEFAAFATDPNIMNVTSQNPHNFDSSISSSTRSSVDSIFSQHSSTSSIASSILDSPTTSSSEGEGQANGRRSSLIHKPKTLRTKKKVSFSQLPPVFSSTDSTTTSTEIDILDRFPSPPSHSPTSPSFTHPRSPPPPRSSLPAPPPLPQTSKSTISSYLLTISLSRYRAHLESLSHQLTYHTTSVHAQIHTLSIIRRARRSNLPDLFVSSSAFSSDSPIPSLSSYTRHRANSNASTSTSTSYNTGLAEFGSLAGISNSEVRKTELAERISRLKEGGWVRKRFDGERYRRLCERVLGEMKGGDEGKF